MSNPYKWLTDLAETGVAAGIDGIVPVKGYRNEGRPLDEVAVMEKAKHYGATAVFFEARKGQPRSAQAFIFCHAKGAVDDTEFAKLHQRLWSWGGVPLVYRTTPGLIQLFRCAHRADFEDKGKVAYKPFSTLKTATQIVNDPWWDAQRLGNGSLWDDPFICKRLLSKSDAAQRTLVDEVQYLYAYLGQQRVLPDGLRRKLLILSLLIAYLEARGVFEDDFFSQFKKGAEKFFEVLADGPALVNLLEHLEQRFNGHVFTLESDDKQTLREHNQLARFSRLIQATHESSGQMTLWQRYSFADLPVELISHIYQLFVEDKATAVYTPPFLVRLMLGEVLSVERMDRLIQNDEIILDPACGSGVFLVEAYKRLVQHWRYRNSWKRPRTKVLRNLLLRVHGCDKEDGAVELAAFSLCLALCDALEPKQIRKSVKLFPLLKDSTLHTGCFFETCSKGKIKDKVGVVVGNPPFSSSLGTDGARFAYENYQKRYGLKSLPDNQIAYLFLHESMALLAEGGVLSMLQQYNFLYNQQSLGFRRRFLENWDVREVLDLISVRGLFKGNADTKVVVVVAEAVQPAPDRKILHATFRRSGRVEAQQGFDIDYYDLHWIPRQLAITNDGVWRSDLLGGGRVLGFVDRLKTFRTLGKYADDNGWDSGEGFIVGKSSGRQPADHLTGSDCLPSKAIGPEGIDRSAITVVSDRLFKTAYTRSRFTAPMVLIREQMDLSCGAWHSGYLTYKDQVVGICGSRDDTEAINALEQWLRNENAVLKAYVAATSAKLFTKKATNLSEVDILSIPYPESKSFDLSNDERIVVGDIVDYYRDLIRLGEDSAAMEEIDGDAVLQDYIKIFLKQINGVYKKNKLRALTPYEWPGVICQPFAFGDGTLDWNGVDELKGKLDKLLQDKQDSGLTVTRIARISDRRFIYLLKPNRRRYWLGSVALRDADETLSDMWEQGF